MRLRRRGLGVRSIGLLLSESFLFLLPCSDCLRSCEVGFVMLMASRTLQGMFPDLDKDVISDVVRMKEGRVGMAVDACLAMSAG